MIYEVYHNAFGDKDIHVANVTVDDTVPVKTALEIVFRKTNNIEGSWSKGPTYVWEGETFDNPDYSENVEVIAPLKKGKDGNTYGLRSTSVGDYVVVNGTKYNCEMVGWKEAA
jgi:hypothetical protein